MLVLGVGLLVTLGFAGILLWQGIGGGVVRKHIPGSSYRPEGWRGADAVAMGWFLALMGVAILFFAFSLGIILGRGGDYMVEWDSLPGFLVTVPLPGTFVAAGAVLLLHASRGGARWAVVPGAGVFLMGLISLAMAVPTWL